MWHKVCRSDQVLIKRDGVGFVGVVFLAVGVDGGARCGC